MQCKPCQIRKGCEFSQPCKISKGLQIFATPANFPVIFDFFIFVFFSLSPYVIVFYLYLLVICNEFCGMKHPKQDFVDILFDI